MDAADKDVDNNKAAKDLVTKAAFHPGFIRYACMRDGGSYSGCKLQRFIGADGVDAVEKCNEFFQEYQNCTVMDMWVEDSEVVVLYTNFMTEEELLDFNDAAEELRTIMARKREERRIAERDAATDEEKAGKEAIRLQEVGRKCEANHKKEKKSK